MFNRNKFLAVATLVVLFAASAYAQSSRLPGSTVPLIKGKPTSSQLATWSNSNTVQGTSTLPSGVGISGSSLALSTTPNTAAGGLSYDSTLKALRLGDSSSTQIVGEEVNIREVAGIDCTGATVSNSGFATAVASGGVAAGKRVRIPAGCLIVFEGPGDGNFVADVADGTSFVSDTPEIQTIKLAGKVCSTGSFAGKACTSNGDCENSDCNWEANNTAVFAPTSTTVGLFRAEAISSSNKAPKGISFLGVKFNANQWDGYGRCAASHANAGKACLPHCTNVFTSASNIVAVKNTFAACVDDAWCTAVGSGATPTLSMGTCDNDDYCGMSYCTGTTLSPAGTGNIVLVDGTAGGPIYMAGNTVSNHVYGSVVTAGDYSIVIGNKFDDLIKRWRIGTNLFQPTRQLYPAVSTGYYSYIGGNQISGKTTISTNISQVVGNTLDQEVGGVVGVSLGDSSQFTGNSVAFDSIDNTWAVVLGNYTEVSGNLINGKTKDSANKYSGVAIGRNGFQESITGNTISNVGVGSKVYDIALGLFIINNNFTGNRVVEIYSAGYYMATGDIVANNYIAHARGIPLIIGESSSTNWINVTHGAITGNLLHNVHWCSNNYDGPISGQCKTCSSSGATPNAGGKANGSYCSTNGECLNNVCSDDTSKYVRPRAIVQVTEVGGRCAGGATGANNYKNCSADGDCTSGDSGSTCRVNSCSITTATACNVDEDCPTGEVCNAVGEHGSINFSSNLLLCAGAGCIGIDMDMTTQTAMSIPSADAGGSTMIKNWNITNNLFEQGAPSGDSVSGAAQCNGTSTDVCGLVFPSPATTPGVKDAGMVKDIQVQGNQFHNALNKMDALVNWNSRFGTTVGNSGMALTDDQAVSANAIFDSTNGSSAQYAALVADTSTLGRVRIAPANTVASTVIGVAFSAPRTAYPINLALFGPTKCKVDGTGTAISANDRLKVGSTAGVGVKAAVYEAGYAVALEGTSSATSIACIVNKTPATPRTLYALQWNFPGDLVSGVSETRAIVPYGLTNCSILAVHTAAGTLPTGTTSFNIQQCTGSSNTSCSSTQNVFGSNQNLSTSAQLTAFTTITNPSYISASSMFRINWTAVGSPPGSDVSVRMTYVCDQYLG